MAMLIFKEGDRVYLNANTYFTDDIERTGTVVGYHDSDYDGHWFFVLLDGETKPRVMIEHELEFVEEPNLFPIDNT